MGTKRGLERLIFFTDAVAAIAITLLILPLVDAVTSLEGDYPDDPARFLGDHWRGLLALAVSFGVIARLWLSHHSIFEHVESYTTPIVVITLTWAFTIVFLPFPTALTYAFTPDRVTVGLYIGTMALNSILLTVMAFVVRGNGRVESRANPVTDDTIRGSLTATIVFLVALAIGLVFPDLNYYGLFLFVFAGPVQALIGRVQSRRRAGTPTPAA